MICVREKLAKHLLALFIFFVLSIFITYPLILNMNDSITGYGDDFYPAFAQNWVIHSLTTDPQNLFNANNFYPQKNTLAYSDPFITSALISAVPVRISGEPIMAVNFNLILSIALLGFGVFILSFYITGEFLPSIIAGILVIFAPSVLDKKVHLEYLSIGWLPISITFFLHFLKTHRSKFFALTLFFSVIQTLDAILIGYFLAFFFTLYVIYFGIKDKKEVVRLITVKNFTILVIAFIPIIFLASFYFKVSSTYHVTRDIRESIHLALQPEDLIYPGESTRLAPLLLSLPTAKTSNPKMEVKPGYLGLVFSFLVFSSVLFFFKVKKKSNYFNLFFYAGVFSLTLSFGPFLHLGRMTIHHPFPIPLPYTLFYYLIPGFKGFRNSSTWEMLFIILIAVCIAILLSYAKKRIKNKAILAFIFGFIVFGTIIEYSFPMKFYPIPAKKDFPQVYSWLNTTPSNSSILILPIYFWNMPNSIEEMKRQFFMTANFRRMVNGYSGFNSTDWEKFVIYTNKNFPSDQSLNKIKNLKVDYLVVDKNKLPVEDLLSNHNLTLVKKLDNFYVFKFSN
jgi:hypothetical protein